MRVSNTGKILQYLLLVYMIQTIYGHGYVTSPASRVSLWRVGVSSPVDYNDNSYNCGGFDHQWNVYGGKCGFCGDPYEGPRQSEEDLWPGGVPAGKGTYANGIISQTYNMGQFIPINVIITANHMGWFEFRLCKYENSSSRMSDDCLNQNLLVFASTGTTRRPLSSSEYNVNDYLKLPDVLTCDHCVLQWKYNAGNNWGCSGTTCGLGYGPQEQFYACSDIAIFNTSGGGVISIPPATQPPTTLPPTTLPPTTVPVTTLAPTTTAAPGTGVEILNKCKAIGPYAGIAGYDTWCVNNCALNNCPPAICKCVILTCTYPLF